MRVIQGALYIVLVSAVFILTAAPQAEAAIHLGGANATSLTNGLVGYWPFDGATTNWTSGQTNDLSGQGNTGTLTNMNVASTPVAGKIGQALKFDGTNSYVDMGDVLNFSSLPVTVGAWVKLNSYDSSFDDVFASDGVTASGQFYTGVELGVNPSGTLEAQFGNNTACGPTGRRDKDGVTALSLGTWHHVVAVVRGATDMSLYIDGVDDGGSYSGSGGAITSTSRSARIGYNHDCGTSVQSILNGSIDDVRVYNRALSATEVQQLYHLGAANAGHSNSVALQSGLVGYWTMDGPQSNWRTNTTADSSGQGNTGTLIDMSTTTSPVAGKIGGALKFTGGNYIDAGAGSSLNISGPITICAWAKKRSLTGDSDAVIVNNDTVAGTGNNTQYDFEFQNSGHFYFAWTDNLSNVEYLSSGSLLVAGAWYHVCAVRYGPGSGAIYLNGKDDTGAHDGSVTPAASPAGSTKIAPPYFGQNVEAAIDDVRIYNRALSAGEIQQLYSLGTVNAGHSNTASISNGLIGYWTFDGPAVNWATGKVADVSGSGNIGQLISMSTTSSPVAGKIGQALKLNGTTSYISADGIAPSIATGDVSMFAWVKFTSNYTTASSFASLMALADAPSSNDIDLGFGGIPFGADHTGRLEFAALDDGPGQFIYASSTQQSTWTAGQWYFVGATISNNRTLTLYVNGVAVNSIQMSVNGRRTTLASSHFDIGENGDGPNNAYFPGTIDDARVYNRALSASEVKQLYNSGR